MKTKIYKRKNWNVDTPLHKGLNSLELNIEESSKNIVSDLDEMSQSLKYIDEKNIEQDYKINKLEDSTADLNPRIEYLETEVLTIREDMEGIVSGELNNVYTKSETDSKFVGKTATTVSIEDKRLLFSNNIANTKTGETSQGKINISEDGLDVKSNHSVSVVVNEDNLGDGYFRVYTGSGRKPLLEVGERILRYGENASKIYHEEFKPTKTDVGLSKVENLTKSEIITGLSTTTELTNAVSTLNTSINGKLGKTETATNSSKLENFTKAQIVTEAKNGMAVDSLVTTSAKGLMSNSDKSKLDGIASGANNYSHPSTHPASIIVEDSTHRFMTDVEKSSITSELSRLESNKLNISDLPSLPNDLMRTGGYVGSAQDLKTETTTLLNNKLDKTASSVNSLLLEGDNKAKIISDSKIGRVENTTTVTGINGLQGGGSLSSNVSLSIKTANESLIVDSSGVKANIVNDLTSGGTNKSLSAEQGKVLMQLMKSESNYFEKVCFYYGYPISINGAWKVDTAVSIYSKYDMVVFGDNYNNPTHQAHADTVLIINKLKEVAKETKIVGYVPCAVSGGSKNLTTEQIKERINMWHNLKINGIFLDEFGYDYQNTRERQNEIISYVKNLGMFCFVNSWEDKYVYSNLPITISWLPDFHPNPNSLPCLLDENDYSLYENFLWDAHTGVQKHQKPWVIYKAYDYYNKIQSEFGKSFYEQYKTKTISLDGITSEIENEEQGVEMRTISIFFARMLNISGVAFGDQNWGSTSNFKEWTLPEQNLKRGNSLDGISVTMIDGSPSKYESFINGDSYLVNWTTSDMDMGTGVRELFKNGKKITNAWETIDDKLDMKLDKSGGTMSGNLTISKDSYPSIFIENTNPSYNKTLRMEHSQNNVLRFIKYKDLSTTTADKILDWNMSAGGVIYHTGNKPTASDVGIQNDYLNDFDGTYGDFCDKNRYGTFSIGPSTFDKLNLPSGTYSYGILIVECSHNGDRMNLTYISDNSKQIFNYNSWNFKNNPTTIFDTNKWTNSFTTQNCPISKAQNGYCKLANGMIMQWGRVNTSTGTVSITFPIAFPNAVQSIQWTDGWDGIAAETTYLLSANIPNNRLTLYSFVVVSTYIENSSKTVLPTGHNNNKWFAIGY